MTGAPGARPGEGGILSSRLAGDARAGVGEVTARRRLRGGGELEVVAALVERQLEDSERGVVADDAVGGGRPEGAVALAPRPGDDLDHPRRARVPARVLGSEALVLVGVAV